jgi:hypothetical protein
MMEHIVRFLQQFATIAWKAIFIFLSSDIQLIQKKHMELFNPMDLIISGWECQGFLVARLKKGLSDTRSGLFTDMVWLITWVHSVSPTLGYLIENTPFQLYLKEKSRSITHWSNITLESRSYSMWHRAVLVRIGFTTSGPTLYQAIFQKPSKISTIFQQYMYVMHLVILHYYNVTWLNISLWLYGRIWTL